MSGNLTIKLDGSWRYASEYQSHTKRTSRDAADNQKVMAAKTLPVMKQVAPPFLYLEPNVSAVKHVSYPLLTKLSELWNYRSWCNCMGLMAPNAPVLPSINHLRTSLITYLKSVIN